MKLKQFNYKKVKSTNQTAIRIIKNSKKIWYGCFRNSIWWKGTIWKKMDFI